MEEAGADAIELNTYFLATDPAESGQQVEERTLDVVREVAGAVSIPVAVKLSPYFSSLAHLARQLVEAGADGLVIFNRFYQPDIDIEELDVVPNLRLSTADELRLRLRWLAVLSGQIETSLLGDRWRSQRGRRHQGRDGRRPHGAAGLGAADPRPRPHQAHPRGGGVLAG
jgi:dihydroorotate dehydrogenase (fumarate)